MSEKKNPETPLNKAENIAKKIDPESDEFDPKVALYANQLPPLDASARVFDNLAMFETKYSKEGSMEVDLSVVQNVNKPSVDISAIQPTASTSSRRFLPEQGMVKGHKKAKHSKNVLNIMVNFEGPLEKLYEFLQKTIRVKIYIRHNHGVRGYVTGFIEIFDKHWNMVLSDVEECYRRRKYAYTEEKTNYALPGDDCSERLKELGIELPQILVKSLNRKNIECRRRIPQLLLRGEQIALVTQYNDHLDLNKK
ncbi:U7 snRNA-associated Sm-like protein Lsm11 [Sergentomyia squamirostris]